MAYRPLKQGADVCPGDLVGVGDPEPGSGDHRSASRPACRHHHGHHPRPAQAEEAGHLLRQSATHQYLRQDLALLLRQGEGEYARVPELAGGERVAATCPVDVSF